MVVIFLQMTAAHEENQDTIRQKEGSKHAHHLFKIVVTGVETAYQVTHPVEKGHSSVDKVAWISSFEEVLAKAIAQIILARQSDLAPKDRS